MAQVTIGGRSYDVEVRGDAIIVDGHEFPVSLREEAGHTLVNAGGVPYRVQLPPAAERASGMTVQVDYRPVIIEYSGRLGSTAAPRTHRPDASASASTPAANVRGAVRAAIAGRILAVRVKVGESVARGDVLLLLEAMKMENEVKATSDGTVKEILVTEGARVSEGETLVVIE